MIRLLWKEMRERWVMHLLWAVGIISVMLIGYSKYFFGVSNLHSDNDPAYFILILAAFTGGSAYTSELSQDRMQFAFSRPLPWWKLLIAKLIPGVIVIILSPLIAFMLFYFSIHHDYHSYLLSSNVISGIWDIIWINAVAFISCFFCSLVLPGFASGFLTVVIICFPLYGLSFMINNNLRYYPNNDGISLGMVIAGIIGFITGGTILAHYFMKMDILSRFLRISLFVVIFYFAGITCGVYYGYYGPYKKTSIEKFDEYQIYYSYSPAGRYVIIDNPYDFKNNSMNSIDFIDLKTGNNIRLKPDNIDLKTGNNIRLKPNNINNYFNYNWLNDDIILIKTGINKKVGKKNIWEPKTYLYQISRNIIFLIDNSYNFANTSMSQDSKYLLCHKFNIKLSKTIGKPIKFLTILSFPDMREVTTFNINGFVKPYWQDNNTLVYIDENGKQQFLQVNEIKQQGAK